MWRTPSKGFTLVELIVVISIIGILTSVVLPRLSGAREKARVALAQVELSQISTAFNIHHDDTGVYPNSADSFCRTDPGSSNETDLSVAAGSLVSNGLSLSGWNGPYVSQAVDPWGNPYYLDEDYQCLATTVGCKGIADADSDSGSSVLVSCGPNGALASGACAYDADNIVQYLCDT